ncbi:MAG: chemotaxis protein CheD [Candidatus Omnitrophota bacterium]
MSREGSVVSKTHDLIFNTQYPRPTTDMEPIKVGMAEYKVASNPAVLASIGLGSCIGIVLYDAFEKSGGLAHIMLPRSSDAKDKSNPAKFADTAIELMLGEIESKGSLRRNIKAKVFGGANMFPSVQSTTLMNVGERNAKVVKEELEKRKIKIVAEELGGNSGRTIYFDTKDGSVIVRTVKGGERVY